MKTYTALFLSAALLAAPFATASESASPVEVLFAKAPDEYTDVRDSWAPTEKGQLANLEVLKKHIEQRAAGYLTDGQKLTVTLTEVDLAGDFEPWRTRQGLDDVRIVKEIYPPRIDLEFKLTDASGNVVSEGKRELRDLAFMMKLAVDRNDAFRHEKELINDWLRRDFKKAK
ncbi:MAG: DUF3016 domain-containing protein [Opitutaceae bacterium]|nr:DUF3016 domain-containing protein [Opitutaceae bacterium]